MTSRLSVMLRVSFLAALTFSFSNVAYGQASRTWISGVGDDANPCSRTAPCKTWAGAISKTAAGGEINAMDPGGYGAVTITKSITLTGTGTMASILAAGTDAIIINITTATDSGKVRIQGIHLNGVTTGQRAIRIMAANEVAIDNVVMDGFANGIRVQSTNTKVLVSNTIIRNMPGIAIVVVGTNEVLLTNSIIAFNGNGLVAGTGGSIVSFGNNLIFANGTDGDPTSTIKLR